MPDTSIILNLRKMIPEWDEKIKAGRPFAVARDLATLKSVRIPREDVIAICEIAKRTQQNYLILRWLKPYVISFDQIASHATDAELALYASALMRLGAHVESRKVLDHSKAEKNPQILLARSHLEIFQWNYQGAIPILKRYLKCLSRDSYSWLVAQLNLAGAYVAVRDWRNAEPLLGFLLQASEQNKSKLIYSNVLELSAQLDIQKADFPSARAKLESASHELAGHGQNYELFVRKWLTVIELLTQPFNSNLASTVGSIKAAARQVQDWETIRDLDLYMAKALGHRELFLEIYFGTRHRGYLERMKKVFPPDFSLPLRYTRNMGGELPSVSMDRPFIDIRSGDTDRPNIHLRRQPTLLRALETLSRDSYAPFRIGALMSGIYPNESFDPITSPRRIYQTLYLLRKWFYDHKLPWDVWIEKNKVSLVAQSPGSLILHRKKISQPPPDLNLAEFLSHWTLRSFTTKDFQSTQKLNERTAQRLLAEGVKQRHLSQERLKNKFVFRRNSSL